MRAGDLARDGGLTVTVDRALAEGVRPDLCVRGADGTTRYVIEVVATHPPDDAALALYRDLELPVVVWSTWDTLLRCASA